MRQVAGSPSSASPIGSAASAASSTTTRAPAGVGIAHRPLGAALAAQQPGEPVAPGREQLGMRRPAAPPRRRARSRPRSALAPPKSARSVTLASVPEQQVDDRARCRGRSARPARHRGRPTSRPIRARLPKVVTSSNPSSPALRQTAMPARPGPGIGGDERPMRRLLRAELRQVEEHDLGRAPDRRPRQATPGAAAPAAGRRRRGPAAPPRCARAPASAMPSDAVARPAARHGRAARRRRDRARAARAAARRRRSRGRPRPR